MNLTLAIAVYANVCKVLGLPLSFPGKPGAYTALYQCTDAALLAKAVAWMATDPKCANQAFNITNSDLIRWQNLWPRFASFFRCTDFFRIVSMSEIATGVTSSLLSRAADVVFKERRRLTLLVREAPLHTGHLRTMTALSELGAIIYPPVPALYTNPADIDEMIDQTIGRVLDLYDIDLGVVARWKDNEFG
jgi:hypothetical protein